MHSVLNGVLNDVLSGLPTGRRRLLLAAAAGAALPQAWAQPAQALAAPRRIVAVGGAITETLYALAAQAELVGVDTTSLYPAEATRLPSVGYSRALSAEGVLSLRPTLVLATAEAGPPAVLRQLEAARLALHVLDADHRFEGLLQRTRRIGELAGRADAGAALAARIHAAWTATQDRVAERVRAGSSPKVLFVLSHSMNQVRIGGSHTAADAVLRYAGARNAFAEVEGFKPLTPEAAIAAAPDVILGTEQGLAAAGGVDGLLAAPGLAQTPAGRNRRVVALEALYLLGFGPRLPQAVDQLAALLHGVVRT